MIGEHGAGAENVGVTMLLTVGAMKLRTLVVWMSWGSLSTGETTVMGIVWAEVFHRLAYIALT